VGAYAQKFKDIARHVPSTELNFIHQFRMGLKPQLKEQMVTINYPSTLREMIDQTVMIEERITELAHERQLENRRPSTHPLTAPPQQPANDKSLSELISNISDNQKSYISRYLQGQCVICGSPSHRAGRCDKRKPKEEGKDKAQTPK
jgi:hypothetical protein